MNFHYFETDKKSFKEIKKSITEIELLRNNEVIKQLPKNKTATYNTKLSLYLPKVDIYLLVRDISDASILKEGPLYRIEIGEVKDNNRDLVDKIEKDISRKLQNKI